MSRFWICKFRIHFKTSCGLSNIKIDSKTRRKKLHAISLFMTKSHIIFSIKVGQTTHWNWGGKNTTLALYRVKRIGKSLFKEINLYLYMSVQTIFIVSWWEWFWKISTKLTSGFTLNLGSQVNNHFFEYF